MDKQRVPLYERLPEIYRMKDEEQSPPGQLRSYLALVEKVFEDIHENIESLYDDLFIETCDDWVIPYIGDLLGTSRLDGDPWTLRADVADTVALRRRKGTLASIERLTYNLTRWGVHCVELRENLVWNQHLNHQRPDAGGVPPYGLSSVTRFTPIRGGTVTLRDPAMLDLLGTPFDPFAHVADVKPHVPFGDVRYNLPNLAIFLWRLEAYRVPVCRPFFRGAVQTGGVRAVRFDVHPMGEPVVLFNTYRFDPDREPPLVTQVDETPGPIPRARLTTGSAAGNPEQYLSVDTYDPAVPASLDVSEVGLQLHLPEADFANEIWSTRGANLCAWETGAGPRIGDREILVDPAIGRIVVGVATTNDVDALTDALKKDLLLTYTYGAVGPVGAHPASRTLARVESDQAPVVEEVRFSDPAGKAGLERALDDVHQRTSPVVVEIEDSMTYELDLATVQGNIPEDGGANLRLNKTLVIRAAEDQRPIVRLKRPLRFRPMNAGGARGLELRLEGLYLTRDPSFPATEPLISRAALDNLEVVNCTLDPGGQKKLYGTPHGSRTPIRASMKLREPYGFADPDDEEAFDQTPRVVLRRTVAGPLLIDGGYHLSLTDSIVDAGKGVGDDPGTSFAVSNATGVSGSGWGPPTEVTGVTVFGRMRVESLDGRGGIWVHALEVRDNQKGCIRYSYFSGQGDRLPQNLGCVRGTGARLRFVDEVFGEPAYGQLAHTSDFRIRERGPGDDAMGAFGFLLEAHKWRNLQIRYREFMPVGVKPLLVPVT